MAEESNFVDYVKVYGRSGKGGRGSTHFHREKYVPKGGPDGGNGGKGGSIILRGNRNYWTLLHLRYDRHIIATNGDGGSAKNSTGADGVDRIIDVPLGTVVYDALTGEYICDIREDNQEFVLLKGGRGGKGNTFFKSSTNQAPRYAQPGEPGEERVMIFQLKMLADVGLVGLPNAGKSTLLATITAAKPKIADYPFTTLEPSLGIVSYRDNRSFVMADIPGIIEGAAEGRGLGLQFLRHIERNALLLFMIPVDAQDIKQEYELLLNELVQYNADLATKKRILAVTKSDLVDDELIGWLKENLPEDLPVIFISSVAQKGIDKLKDVIWQELSSESLHEVDDIITRNLDLSRIVWEKEEDVLLDDIDGSRAHEEDFLEDEDSDYFEVDWD